jgi:flagellar motility protein MotE (MotC chaperone)
MVTGRGNRAVDRGRMARDLEDLFKINLKTLLEETEKSGNLRKDLKDDVMKSVSSLRGIYNTLMANLEEKTRKIENLESQMTKSSDALPETNSVI